MYTTQYLGFVSYAADSLHILIQSVEPVQDSQACVEPVVTQC